MIKKCRMTPFQPLANELIKRWNYSIMQMLSCIVQGDSYNWDKCLNVALFAYNVCPQTSTGFSPLYLDHLQEPRFPTDNKFCDELNDDITLDGYQWQTLICLLTLIGYLKNLC